MIPAESMRYTQCTPMSTVDCCSSSVGGWAGGRSKTVELRQYYSLVVQCSMNQLYTLQAYRIHNTHTLACYPQCNCTWCMQTKALLLRVSTIQQLTTVSHGFYSVHAIGNIVRGKFKTVVEYFLRQKKKQHPKKDDMSFNMEKHQLKMEKKN